QQPFRSQLQQSLPHNASADLQKADQFLLFEMIPGPKLADDDAPAQIAVRPLRQILGLFSWCAPRFRAVLLWRSVPDPGARGGGERLAFHPAGYPSARHRIKAAPFET